MAEVTEGKIMQILDWSYDQIIKGIPGSPSVYDLVESYRSKHLNDDEIIEELIGWQLTKAFTTGFTTGLGGIAFMPITLPANITSSIYIQMRMIAAIALVRGFDLKDDQVQTLVYVCLTGKGINDILKETSITIAKKTAITSIKRIPNEILKEINKKVGFKLFTKFGEKGVVNFVKLVPVLGGIVGGIFDTASTVAIAEIAKSTFVANKYKDGDIIMEL